MRVVEQVGARKGTRGTELRFHDRTYEKFRGKDSDDRFGIHLRVEDMAARTGPALPVESRPGVHSHVGVRPCDFAGPGVPTYFI